MKYTSEERMNLTEYENSVMQYAPIWNNEKGTKEEELEDIKNFIEAIDDFRNNCNLDEEVAIYIAMRRTSYEAENLWRIIQDECEENTRDLDRFEDSLYELVSAAHDSESSSSESGSLSSDTENSERSSETTSPSTLSSGSENEESSYDSE